MVLVLVIGPLRDGAVLIIYEGVGTLERLRLHASNISVNDAHLLLHGVIVVLYLLLLLMVLVLVLVLDLGLRGHTVLHLKLVLLMSGLAGCSIALLASKSVTSLLFEPIEVVIVLEALTVEQVLEDCSERIVVWPLFEGESSDLLHVGDELI